MKLPQVSDIWEYRNVALKSASSGRAHGFDLALAIDVDGGTSISILPARSREGDVAPPACIGVHTLSVIILQGTGEKSNECFVNMPRLDLTVRLYSCMCVMIIFPVEEVYK